MSRNKGLRKAADMMCKECIYDPLDKGTWRQQVQGCACKECPLYNFRPLPIEYEDAS